MEMMAQAAPSMARRAWCWLLLPVLLFFYLAAFGLQERHYAAGVPEPTHPPPPALQEIALGYLRQLGGEIQFIKAAVYYGHVDPERDAREYAAPLAARLAAAAQLHPHFLDTYYLAQALLPHIDDEYAAYANRIHARGMAALPDQFVLPFFVGFNHFYYLKDPVGAAGYLQQAVELPGAPSWFGHLAGALAGEGGDIYGGLFWLRAMLVGEEDEGMRERYRHSIAMFERAVVVQRAIEQYRARQGRYPLDLAELVPAELAELPEFDPPFQLSWEPPTLRLLRLQDSRRR